MTETSGRSEKLKIKKREESDEKMLVYEQEPRSYQDGGFFRFLLVTYSIYKRQLYRLWSNKLQVIMMLLMPLMWMVIIGQTFDEFLGTVSGSRGPLPGGLDYITYMTPGVLIMVTLFTGLFGGIALFYDKESGYLKNYLIAPIPRISILIGYSMGTVTRILIQVTLLLAVGIWIGAQIDLTIQTIVAIYLFTTLMTFFLMGLAITLAARAPNVEVFQAMVMPIAMPLQFLSPVLYPVDMMPDYLQWIAKINPLTFGIDGLRAILFGADFVTTPLIDTPLVTDNLALFNLIFLLLAATFFLVIGSRAYLKSLEG